MPTTKNTHKTRFVYVNAEFDADFKSVNKNLIKIISRTKKYGP